MSCISEDDGTDFNFLYVFACVLYMVCAPVICSNLVKRSGNMLLLCQFGFGEHDFVKSGSFDIVTDTVVLMPLANGCTVQVVFFSDEETA